jgi:hypothetical protein
LEISGPTSTQESKVQNQPTSVFGKPSTQESKTESQSASVFGPKKQTLFGPSGLFASQEPTFQPPLTHRKTSQNVTGLFRCLHGTETPQKGVWSPETIKPCQSSDLFGSLLGANPKRVFSTPYPLPLLKSQVRLFRSQGSLPLLGHRLPKGAKLRVNRTQKILLNKGGSLREPLLLLEVHLGYHRSLAMKGTKGKAKLRSL